MIEDEEGPVRETGSGREIFGPAEPSVFRDAIFAVLEVESRLKREGNDMLKKRRRGKVQTLECSAFRALSFIHYG